MHHIIRTQVEWDELLTIGNNDIVEIDTARTIICNDKTGAAYNNIDILRVKNGYVELYIRFNEVVVRGNACVLATSGNIHLYDSSTGTFCGDCKVTARDKSFVFASRKCVINAYDSSFTTAGLSSWDLQKDEVTVIAHHQTVSLDCRGNTKVMRV